MGARSYPEGPKAHAKISIADAKDTPDQRKAVARTAETANVAPHSISSTGLDILHGAQTHFDKGDFDEVACAPMPS